MGELSNMEEISFGLVGKVLEEDIFSEFDILLLKKGTILTETNILLLQKHNFMKVAVSENRSNKSLYLNHLKNIEELFKIYETGSEQWFEKEKSIVRKVQKEEIRFGELYQFGAEPTLYRHSANVGIIAFFLGKLMRYSYKNKLLLWEMGILHDIGKVNSPWDEPKNQTDTYKSHPEVGWKLLKKMKGVNVMLLNAARHHHELLDGTGFPNGVNVKYLPVMVQIITVANRVDNLMTTNHNTFSLINELMAEVRGNKLNPAIVVPFIRHLIRNQLGKRVVLNDATKCEIIYIFEQEPAQPLLYIEDEDTFIDLRSSNQLKIVDYA